MPDEILWQMFKETGDPLCWLIHRAVVNCNTSDRDKSRPA